MQFNAGATIVISFVWPGVSTFKNEIAGRNVLIFSDNVGAEGATRKGVITWISNC